MAFENLSSRLQDIFKNLKSKGKLTEKDVKDALREVKLALLEADVNFKIVKDFINKLTEKSVGENIFNSLTPGQQVIKIVNEELTNLMGETQSKLTFSANAPTVYMIVGLQGAGKTTTTAKLAGILRKENKKPLLVACDVQRPAAIKQLQVLGKNYNIPVFSIGDKNKPVDIAKASLSYAKENGNDLVIIDTAGRLHIDDELMEELINIKEEVKPQEILMVIDAMTGQDGVNITETFNEKLNIDGVIITKLDGDTRGGVALSIKYTTGKPIKYIGVGEKLEDLEPFYPDRMASRILGMGDILSLIEKAQVAFDEEKTRELEKKIKNQEFSLEDFLQQMQQVKKMGPLKNIINMIPGISNKINLDNTEIDKKAITHVEAIILSMTKEERKKPSILNGSRKKRISQGSGRSIQEVNLLLKQFEEMKKMMKYFTNTSKMKKGNFNIPFFK